LPSARAASRRFEQCGKRILKSATAYESNMRFTTFTGAHITNWNDL
jgi:hypothetical protein